MSHHRSLAEAAAIPLHDRPDCGESDAHLMRRFIARRDDLAFAKIVERHGPMVMGVCHRILADEQEAEDAFQATFLVLARKADSLREASTLPAWLHRTAFRISLRCRANRHQRRETTLESAVMLENHPALVQIASDHHRSVLDEELNRLPARLRLPLFLCCIEGKSREEAAGQLGWSVGSLKGRLERARATLRRRLSLRGISLSVALSLWMQSHSTAQAAVAPSLVACTVQAGTQFAAGKPAIGYVTVNALHLANGSLSFMPVALIKPIAGSLVTCGLLIGIGNIPVSVSADFGDGEVIRVHTALADRGGTTLVAAQDDDDEGQRPEARNDRAQQGDEQRQERETRDRPERGIADSGGPRRERDRDNAGERRGDRERPSDVAGDEEFRPQTEREASLYRMILQLRREVAELKRATSTRAVAEQREARRDGDRESQDARRIMFTPTRGSLDGELPSGWERSRGGKVFAAYDRNKDRKVTLDEWYAMKEGLTEGDTARRELEAGRFKQADPNSDGKMTVAEFLFWYDKGRFQTSREGDAGSDRADRGQRDGDRASEVKGPGGDGDSAQRSDREQPRADDRGRRDGDRAERRRRESAE